MSLEELLITHASPTLGGVKPASLISLCQLDGDDELPMSIRMKGISSLLLQRGSCRLLLVYRERMLSKVLSDERNASFLSALGYGRGDTVSMLSQLAMRFSEEGFPHEIGVFLGYPLDDVAAFIENGGRNAIATGMWKVYGNKQEAEELQAGWMECSRAYMGCFRKGISIERLCVTA